MATTTRKRTTQSTATPKREANGEFAKAPRRRVQAKTRAKSLIPDVDFSTRNIALGTAAVAGAAIAGALFAAWRSNAFADLFERDLISGDKAQEARDVIDEDDRDQFAPATVPLRDGKYDRELSAN